MSIETRGFTYGEIRGKAKRNAIAYSANVEYRRKAKADGIRAVIIAATVVVVLLAVSYYLSFYTVPATVTEVGDGITTFELANGNQFDVETYGTYAVGDKVSLTFDTNGTDNDPTDDRVVNVQN